MIKILTVFLSLIPLVIFAKTYKEIELKSKEPGVIVYNAFSLSKEDLVRVKGTCANFRDGDKTLMYYGWILKSETREVVWNLLDKENNNKDKPVYGVYNFNDEFKLPEGEYEIYLVGMYHFSNYKKYDMEDWFRDIPSSNPTNYDMKYLRDIKFTVSSTDLYFTEINPEDVIRKFTSSALVSFNRIGINQLLEKSFTITAPSRFNIYSVGETLNHDMYDYAYITDLRSKKIVWIMSEENTSYAGGGDKNRMINNEILLQPGNYKLIYVTDDSHSFNSWNVMPPNDPLFWGVTIWPKTSVDLANVRELDESISEPLVQIVHVKDHETVSKEMEVQKPVKVKIVSFGEFANSQAADYGYILNADTREIVWVMDKEKAEHAGGADKNFVQYDELNLPPGKYIVTFTTDDSHSYSSWNSAPPFDQDSWGITLWTENESDKHNVRVYEYFPGRELNSLEEITRVKNSSKMVKIFTADHDMYVTVYAIGEGLDNEMYDYGWITDSYGSKIWEMKYERTTYAGGAEKNRMIREKIFLKKGSYILEYRTDGSHSYNSWNDAPPFDKEKYGISILKD